MKDQLGREVAAGDMVLYSAGLSYAGVSLCRVVRLTPQKAVLCHMRSKCETTVYPHYCIVVDSGTYKAIRSLFKKSGYDL